MTVRYYVLEIDTSAPEHKFDKQDEVVCRELHHSFGSQATVYRVGDHVREDVAVLLPLMRRIDYVG